VTTPPQDPNQGQYQPPTQGYQQPQYQQPTQGYQQPQYQQPYQGQGQGQYGQPGQYPTPGAYPGAPQQAGYGAPAGDPSQYSDWASRVGAYLIDIAPIIVLIFIGVVLHNIAVALIIDLASLGWTVYNRWYQGGTTGQSLGKETLGMKLVSESTGQPIGPLMAFVRDICHFVDSVICYVGYLFPLWDAKRQTLADKIVSTVVIPVPKG
jgi:uncharacterized RDD family membrane protein YckC